MKGLPRVVVLTLFVAACSDESRTGSDRVPAVLVNDEDLAIAANSSGGAAASSATDQNYVPQTAYYKSVNWTHGNGLTEQGGVPPAREREPPPILSNFDVSQWYFETTSPAPSTGAEAKFRTHCNYSHIAYDDPIVYPGKPGASHLHMFFGNTLANAYSTYRTLRTTGGSTCGGGPLNRSAYWFPAVLKDNATGDGKTKVVKPDHAVVYYNVDDRVHTRFTRLFRGLTYVFGFNPADPGNSAEKAEIAESAATATKEDPGGLHSYLYLGNGFAGWKCENTNGANSNSPLPGSHAQPYLRNANGSATLTCPTSERIAAVLSGPTCWDGYNLTSPNGRGHVRQYIGEINSGRVDICPDGWFEIPAFVLTIWFSHNGPDDYKEWYLSSDRMPGMTQFLNGQSFHTDWFGAWDYRIMKIWMVHCNGIRIGPQPGDPHSCIDTQFGDGTAGLVAAPAPDATRVPQVNLGIRWADKGADQYMDLPDAAQGSAEHAHEMETPAPSSAFNNPPDDIIEEPAGSL